MKTMTFRQWAADRGACDQAVVYLKGKRCNWATWIGSCGDWRSWVCRRLRLAECGSDRPTFRNDSRCSFGCRLCDRIDAENAEMRFKLNEPAAYSALYVHWETVVLPALRKAGVR